MIWRLIIGGLWKPLLGILALVGIYAKGRSDAKAKADHKRAKEALETHERINDAPDLRNASDDDRAEWLRDFAKRNGGA